MSFRVVVTERAERDIRSIGDWLHERSPGEAKRWILAAWQAIDRLGKIAGACPHAPENDQSERDIHNILFKTPKGCVYRAVFIIENDPVTVTHIRGPGQNVIPPEDFDETE